MLEIKYNDILYMRNQLSNGLSQKSCYKVDTNMDIYFNVMSLFYIY